MKLTSAKRSGSLPPSRMSNRSSSTQSPNVETSFNSCSSSTGNLFDQNKSIYYKMSYVLVSTDDFHRGPTRISTIDPYLHEKVPFTVIKDSLYFKPEPQYDPHGRFWKFRVEDAPVRVLNKLLDLGYKVLTGTSITVGYDHKQPGHAWTLFRDPNIRYSPISNH